MRSAMVNFEKGERPGYGKGAGSRRAVERNEYRKSGGLESVESGEKEKGMGLH